MFRVPYGHLTDDEKALAGFLQKLRNAEDIADDDDLDLSASARNKLKVEAKKARKAKRKKLKPVRGNP